MSKRKVKSIKYALRKKLGTKDPKSWEYSDIDAFYYYVDVFSPVIEDDLLPWLDKLIKLDESGEFEGYYKEKPIIKIKKSRSNLKNKKHLTFADQFLTLF